MKRQILRKRITYISFFLFPATCIYFSPYIILTATAKGIISGSFFMFILLFLSALILGRKIRNLFKFPSLKLNKTQNECVNCHLCTKNCPMSLDVEHMVQNSKMEDAECILCGSCANVCRKECIQLKFN